MRDVCKSCVVENLCEKKNCSDDNFEGIENPCEKCLLVNICVEDCEDKTSWRYWLEWDSESLYIAEGTKSAAHSIPI